MKNKKIISYKYVGYDPMNECGIYRVSVYEEERNGMLWPTTMAISTAIRKLRDTIEYLEEFSCDEEELRVWKQILKEVREDGKIPFSVLA